MCKKAAGMYICKDSIQYCMQDTEQRPSLWEFHSLVLESELSCAILQLLLDCPELLAQHLHLLLCCRRTLQ